MKAKAAQARVVSSNQLERIFDTLPDGVIACDSDGKILRINATALKLFEVPSEHLARGTPCQQFLHSYQLDRDQQQQAISLEPWLTGPLSGAEAATGQQVACSMRLSLQRRGRRAAL